MKKTGLILSALLFSAFSSASFAASDEITLTLDGKSVKSISVDKLDKLKFNIKTSKSFKQIFSGQWGKLDSALIVVAEPFKKGSPVPDLSHYEGLCTIENTYDDSTWPSKTSSGTDMFKIAKSTKLYNADTSENIAIGVRYSRKEYTGKNVWKDGGWVQETRWVDVGPILGKTVLSLEIPAFAKSINWDSVFQEAAENMNTKKQDPSSFDNTSALSKSILKGSSYEASAYDGSKILSIKKAGEPTYSWNYEENADSSKYVTAKMPVEVNIHTVKKGELLGGLEADFKCGHGSHVATKKYSTKGTFEKGELSLDSGFEESCLTADGKKASEIAGSSNNAKPNAGDLLNGFMKNLK